MAVRDAHDALTSTRRARVGLTIKISQLGRQLT
jgi:hypothetical protein